MVYNQFLDMYDNKKIILTQKLDHCGIENIVNSSTKRKNIHNFIDDIYVQR
jgi:hypothetical protein